ncbi:hypothetical protein QT986_16145 [Microcoleus sp. herbarium14]
MNVTEINRGRREKCDPIAASNAGRAIAHKQSQVRSQLLSPRTRSHYSIPQKSHSNVSIALTHQHHFVLRTTTCDNIDTAIYIWRVFDVR